MPETIWPYTWDARKPLYKEGIFFLPEFMDSYEKSALPKDVFEKTQPLSVEFCSGNGAWIIECAKNAPERNWIAIEMRADRAAKIRAKSDKLGIKNLLVVLGEGLCFAKNYLDRDSISEVYVNFPDPWPKDRHAKHRIISDEFLTEIERIMKNGGCLTIVTDDSTYAGQIQELTADRDNLYSIFPKPFYTHSLESYGSSFFRELWESKGKKIYFHRYTRR